MKMPTDSHGAGLALKLSNHTAKIGIIGLGYVGLPLTLRFSEVFSTVYGFDIDPLKVDALNGGVSYIKQIDCKRIQSALTKGFIATTDFSLASACDALIICVPTPLTKHFEPDLSFIRITTEAIVPYLRKDQVIVLESTTFPGTTEELIVPRVTNSGFKPGEDIFIVYSPEREDPGNSAFTTQTIPKIVGGHTDNCLKIGTALYSQVIDQVVQVSNTKTAEMTKLLENIHRAVNIGLVNEMKIVADKMGIDIHEVIDAAATKPFGFTKYSPGPGFGGHCIPIDPFYLTWKAKEYGVNTRFIELSGEVNRTMPSWIVTKLSTALNNIDLTVKDAKILILGIAYKKNVDDSRESPAIKIMELLRDLKADISYSDPHIPAFPSMREHQFNLASIELTPTSIAGFDAILIATDHDEFDYENILQYGKLIIDTRNRLPSSSKVIKA